MSIPLLKTFVAIADHGSFSAAADYVGISTAAVGQQMKRLEAQLQVTLFDRSRSTPRLNQLGHALLPKAREVVQSFDSMLHDLPGSADWTGELSLGAVPSSIRGLVPLSVKSLMQRSPGLHIRVVPGLTEDLLEQVERGALDAAVLSEPRQVGRELHWLPLVSEELVLLTSSEVRGSDAVQLLETHPYIRYTRRASVGALADDWLARNNVNVNTSMEMESLESVASMVSYGLGVSIAPNLSVPDPIFASLRKVSLGTQSHARVLGVVVRTDSAKASLVQQLVVEIRESVKPQNQVRHL